MRALQSLVGVLRSRNRGATSIEYALIAAGISLVIVVAAGAIGTTLAGAFARVSSGFN